MRINPFLYAGLVLVVFLGVIYGFQTAGVWAVSGKVDAQGKMIQPVGADTSSIKGWMTLEQITIAYNVTLEEIIQTFNLPVDTSLDTELRALESDTFSVSALRQWLQTHPPIQQSVPTNTPVLTSTPTPAALLESTDLHTLQETMVNRNTTFQDLLDWGLSQVTIEQVIGLAMPEPSVTIRNFIKEQGLQFSVVKDALQVEVDKLK